MEIQDFVELTNEYSGVTTDIKWEDHLCFNVGLKMFLITSPDNVPHTASFKVSDEDFNDLIEKEGFKPAPYLARYKWVFVDDINRLDYEEWNYYINKSYHLIASKLPAKLKKELNIKN